MPRPGPLLVLVTTLVVVACAGEPVTRPEAPSRAAPSVAGSPSSSEDLPTGSPPVVPTTSESPDPPPPPAVVGEPDAERAVRLASLLSRDVGPRPAGSRADLVARLAVASWFRDAGWEVEEQPVPLPQGGGTANLVARWKGRGAGEPHVLVGAHLDTVAGSPGANDNASGVGALVALATELADEAQDLAVPVVFVAFGAEEYQPVSPRAHHLGSEVYADAAGGDVIAMLSVDMIGRGPATCICWFDAGPSTLADRLAVLASPEGFRLERRGDVSDHGPFARRGVPAALLWSYSDGRLHTPADTSEHLQVAALRRTVELVAAFLRDLDPGEVGGLAPAP